MIYSEATYFDGYHFAHIAAYEAHRYRARRQARAAASIARERRGAAR